MNKLSFLARPSFLIGCLFLVDKALAFVRAALSLDRFGLTTQFDAFNAANNLPDLLFALISGGALAMAFIPVLSETLQKQDRQAAWDLFSRIANLMFLITGSFAVVLAILAGPLVTRVVTPGFSVHQQQLVTQIMRLD